MYHTEWWPWHNARENESLGLVTYCIDRGNDWFEVRNVWVVPAPCYPEPDIGAIIDALRHAR